MDTTSRDFRTPATLGRTGLAVGRLGLASAYGVPAAAIERAFHEHGVNYLYVSLPKRGQMVQALRHLVPAHRDRLVLVLQSYARWGLFLEGQLTRALRAIGTDHVDVLILGWHNGPPSPRLLERVARLKERGIVRFTAMSGHHRPTFGTLAGQGAASPIDVLMVRYNAAHRGAEREVFPHLPAQDRPGVTTYTATSWRQLLQARRMPPGERPLTAAGCYRFVLTNPAVDLCLMGPASAAQLDEGLQALAAGPMSDEELARARRLGDHVHG